MLILSFIFLSSVILWVLWWREVRNGSAPMMKGSLPVIGYSHAFIGNTEKLWRVVRDISNFSNANGGVIRLVIALKTYYVVTDPEDLTIIGNNLLKKHFSFDCAKPWLGDGLLTASTSAWKTHRKLLNPAFSLPLLQSFLPVLNDQARITVQEMAKEVGKGPQDLSGYMRENAIKVLCRTSLDLSLKEIAEQFGDYNSAADKALEQLATRFQNAWLHSDFIYWLVGLRGQENDRIRIMNQMANRVIKAKMEQLKNLSYANEQKHKPFLNLLLEMASENKMSQKDVLDEVHTMFVAGTDTSSWMLNNLCVILGTHKDVQERVYDELAKIIGDTDKDLTKEDLAKMVYTEAVIKETLRLYPVATVSLRTVEQGLQLKKYYLRPGDHVIMSFYGLNRHAMWGPDADQFRPERWLDSVSLPKNFAGFGVGKRNCIGKTYALIAVKVLIVHIVRRYHLTADATKLILKVDFISKPVRGHLVNLTERKT